MQVVRKNAKKLYFFIYFYYSENMKKYKKVIFFWYNFDTFKCVCDILKSKIWENNLQRKCIK